MSGWLLVFALFGWTAAAECPFGAIESSSATMTMVSVNGQTYSVRGLLPRAAFREALIDCGEHDAARHFTEWRRMRRWTNLCIIAGFPSVGLFWVGAGVTALQAGGQKERMLMALQPEQML
jgi:hypothetical protein